jgi:hypothetical protein
MSVPCTQEGKIARIDQRLETIEKILNPLNGPSLHETTIILNQNTKNLNESMEEMSKHVSGFLKFQAEITATIEADAKHKANRNWMIGIILTLSGVVITLMIELFKNKS